MPHGVKHLFPSTPRETLWVDLADNMALPHVDEFRRKSFCCRELLSLRRRNSSTSEIHQLLWKLPADRKLTISRLIAGTKVHPKILSFGIVAEAFLQHIPLRRTSKLVLQENAVHACLHLNDFLASASCYCSFHAEYISRVAIQP